MKNIILSILAISFFVCIAANRSSSQVRRAEHEKPVIANAVPNIPDELIQSGKLSKYVALSLPDDERWNPDNINLNANGAVYAIAPGGSRRSCFIGGHFDSIDVVAAKHLAFFDDNAKTFSDVGGGINGDVYAILRLSNDELYVAGSFTKAGNVDAHNIAHWTGSKWEPLGSGTDLSALALAFVANDLYVGGNFLMAGGQTANYIARWDTMTKAWQTIIDGASNGVNGGVAALAVTLAGDLYVGGGFTKAGLVPANKISVLSAGKWQALGNGIEGPNAFVSCIAINPNNFGPMYVGGNFQSAGGMAAHNIASLSGNIWQTQSDQLTKGFDKPVYTIADAGGNFLYAGGDFTKFGDSSVNFIAQLQGLGSSSPIVMGSGLDGTCYTLAGRFIFLSLQGSYFNHLYVGGKFTQAGLKPSQNFAIWGESIGGSVKQNPSLASQVTLYITPNPVQTSAALSFTLPDRMFTSVSIFDALGREVLSLGGDWREAGVQELRFDVKNLPSGAYYCRLTSLGQTVINTFIVTR